VDHEQLVEAARAARERAYAPYSKFRMGSAVATAEGSTLTGAVVENVSLGLAMCAERVALFSAVAAGARASGASATAAAAVAAPAMPAVPVLPVDARPLPALPAPADVRLAPIPVALRPTVRVAAPAEAQDAVLMPAGPAEVSAAAVALAGTIELANGNGRRLMAARMQAYLGQSGIVAARLTNADHFAHAATLITFRPGHRGLAEALSASLPVTPRLQEVSAQASDVRVLLGGDLLEFDRALLQAERIRSHADAV